MSTSLSPTHEPVFNVFGDYFWSSDRNITEGVNVLYEASKVSLNNTKLLAELFQEHLDMEREYNKRLKKLSDKVRCVNDDKNTMAPVWKNLSTMYTSMSEMHSQYLKDLSLTHKSISSYSSEEKKNAGSLTKQLDQANSLKQQYNKSFQQYSTSKSQFYIVSQSVQKSNHSEVGSSGSTEHTEQEGELVRSQDEYKTSVSKHQSSVQQTVNKLFSIFVEFECFEKQRFSKICGIIQEFVCVFSKFFVRVSKIIEGTGESIKSIENSKESILIDFASRYGTKGHRPISPCYDDPPNVAELETELGPRPIYRSPSAQSVESDKSKPDTPKSKRSHKVGNKYEKKAKSKNFLKKRSKTQPEPEPSTQNPNFNPEQSMSLSKTPSPIDTLLPGFVLDEDGYRVRVDDGGTSPQPRSGSSSSSSSSDVEKNTSADVLRNMRINQPKSLLDESNDNTADLYMVIDKLKLGAPRTNLSARKSNSANQLTQGTDSSIENLIAPLRQKNTNIEDMLLSSTSSLAKRQSSAPREAEWDQDSEPDRTKTPTPVDPTQDGLAFPQLSGLDPYVSTFSNDFSTPRINAKLSLVPALSKEDDFTFTNNFSNPPDNMTPTLSKNPLSFSTSSPSFIPLPPPVVPLPPPVVPLPLPPPPSVISPSSSNSVLRHKPLNKLSIGNRMIQIIPESEFDSPTHSTDSAPLSPDPPDPINRADSSMSFTSEIARGSSPGSDTIPVALSLEETIHVLYKHNQLTDQFVRLVGKLKIAFLSNNIETLHQSDLVFAMEGENLLPERFKCNQGTLLSREGEEFCFKMEPLKEYLLQERASTPGKSFTVLDALAYSVKLPVTAPPLLLTVTWDPDSRADQTVVDIQYKYNPDGFPILSPYPLENVVFTVNYGSKISEVELVPAGQHVKPNYTVMWKRDIVSSQINATGKLTAIFTHFPDHKLPHLVEVSFKANHTLSSTQVRLKRPGFNIAKTKRNLCSGVYKSEN